MKTNSLNDLFSDIFIFVIGTVLAKVIQFVLLPLYTSYMTTDTYGVAELVNNLSELFLPIVSLCLYDAVLRFTVEKKNNSIVISSALKVLTISFLILVPILFLIYLFWTLPYVLLFGFIVYAYSIQRLFSCYVRGKGYSKVYALSGAVNAVFVAFFSGYFLVIKNFKVEGYLLAIALGYVLSAIYLFISGKIYKDIKMDNISTKVINEMIRFSTPLIPFNIMYFFLTLAGRYILLWESGEKAVGLYSAAIKIAAIVNVFQQAVSTALQLNVSREYTSQNKEKYYSYIFDLFHSGYWTIASWVMCLCPLLAKLLLRNEFYNARIYLPLILIAAILNCISAMYGTMFQAYKLTNKNVPIVGVGMIINITVCLILVPRYEIWGVCVASVISYLSQVVMKIKSINSFCKIKYKRKTMIVFPGMVVVQVVAIMISSNIYMYLVLSIIALWETQYFIHIYYKELKRNISLRTVS